MVALLRQVRTSNAMTPGGESVDQGSSERLRTASRLGQTPTLNIDARLNFYQAKIGASSMAKKPARTGERWTPSEVQQLKKEIKENTPTRVMGLKHDRTAEAVQAKANNLGLSTKPPNQRPYGTKKK